MKTAYELREELCKIFDEIKDGKMAPKTAREMIKSTNAQIALAKVQLEYAAMKNVVPDIKFLDCN